MKILPEFCIARTVPEGNKSDGFHTEPGEDVLVIVITAILNYHPFGLHMQERTSR